MTEFHEGETMRAMKFGVGQPVKRVEDVRLVSGQGPYASDQRPRAALYAAFVRSPHAHARFVVTGIEAAAPSRACAAFTSRATSRRSADCPASPDSRTPTAR